MEKKEVQFLQYGRKRTYTRLSRKPDPGPFLDAPLRGCPCLQLWEPVLCSQRDLFCSNTGGATQPMAEMPQELLETGRVPNHHP